MTGKPRNPSANRLTLPVEMETRARALELAMQGPYVQGNFDDSIDMMLRRARRFANFIDQGNIHSAPETTVNPASP